MIPVTKIESVTGPQRIGTRAAPRWVVSAVLTAEPDAQALAALLTSGREAAQADGTRLVWQLGDRFWDGPLPPRQVPLVINGIREEPGLIIIEAEYSGVN